MRKIFLISILAILAASSSAQYDKYFELYGHATLNNSYAIGKPVQTWINDDVMSGSPAFYNIGGTSFMSTGAANTLCVGVDFSITIPPSHSIWGSNLYFGGRTELVLNPYTVALGMPFRYAFNGKNFSVQAEPAFLITIMTGKYSTSGIVNVDDHQLTGTFNAGIGSMGMGFGFNVGAQYYLGNFGLGIKYGLRSEKASLSFNDATAGAWSPVDSNDEPLKLDLGGSYLTVGLMIRFMKTYGEE
jgi:hypothetical protein